MAGLAGVLAAMTLAGLAGAAAAQTPFSSLSAPQGPPGLARSPARAKDASAPEGNPCSSYGAGFVAVPGSKTCVKAGMAIRTEVSGDVHR